MNDLRKAISAQGKFCDEHDYPYFAPVDGVCPKCRHTIYGPDAWTVEAAESTLVTYCPFCHYSFVE